MKKRKETEVQVACQNLVDAICRKTQKQIAVLEQRVAELEQKQQIFSIDDLQGRN